jgi:hypothetical protein
LKDQALFIQLVSGSLNGRINARPDHFQKHIGVHRLAAAGIPFEGQWLLGRGEIGIRFRATMPMTFSIFAP